MQNSPCSENMGRTDVILISNSEVVIQREETETLRKEIEQLMERLGRLREEEYQDITRSRHIKESNN